MEREPDTTDLIDLGTASVETQGILGRKEDVGLQLEQIGMTDD